MSHPHHPLELHMVFQSVLTVRNTTQHVSVPGPFEETKFDKHRPKVRVPKQTMTISKRGTSKCQNIANSVAMNTSANGTAGLKWTRLQNQPCEFKVFQSTTWGPNPWVPQASQANGDIRRGRDCFVRPEW